MDMSIDVQYRSDYPGVCTGYGCGGVRWRALATLARQASGRNNFGKKRVVSSTPAPRSIRIEAPKRYWNP